MRVITYNSFYFLWIKSLLFLFEPSIFNSMYYYWWTLMEQTNTDRLVTGRIHYNSVEKNEAMHLKSFETQS